MTSRAAHAAVGVGLAACFPLQLLGFGYALYEHSIAADKSHDPWGNLMFFAAGSFVITLALVLLLLVDVSDENALDRK